MKLKKEVNYKKDGRKIIFYTFTGESKKEFKKFTLNKKDDE